MADDADSTANETTSPDLLSQAEALFEAQAEVFGVETLTGLQELAAGHPDLGAQGSGEVIAELMMLTEQMIAAGRHDRDPVAVFLQAWRLLQTTTPDGEAKVALLSGLKTVRSLYEAPRAA